MCTDFKQILNVRLIDCSPSRYFTRRSGICRQVSEPPPRPSLQELGITKVYASVACLLKPAALLTIDDRAIQLEGD